ncbi:MAG: hypothetical protein KF824_10765 [Fimbriimonadaceae bacterium]|nr:MAG: hypothetical protein KF824_10765 [Fimbriimonadaceae bacterium]
MTYTSPDQYWSPTSERSLTRTVQRRLIHLVSRLLFAFLVAYLVQGISGKIASGTAVLALTYGIGLFVTQWLNSFFIDLATSDKLGSIPSKNVSKVMAFFGVAIRGVPHSIFLAWMLWMFNVTEVFPDMPLIISYQVVLPLFSLRKLTHAPLTIIPGNVRLLLDRQSDLYAGILERFKGGEWLENMKYVRMQTNLSPRDALFLLNLVLHDDRIRRNPDSKDPQDPSPPEDFLS